MKRIDKFINPRRVEGVMKRNIVIEKKVGLPMLPTKVKPIKFCCKIKR